MHFRFQTSLYRIYGRQIGTGTDFSPTRYVSTIIIIQQLLLTLILIIYHPATQCQKFTVPLYKSVYTYKQGKSIKEVKQYHALRYRTFQLYHSLSLCSDILGYIFVFLILMFEKKIIQSLPSPYKIYGGRCGTGTVFFSE